MFRKPFALGLALGIVIGGLAMIAVFAHTREPVIPSLGPLPSAWGTVVPVSSTYRTLPRDFIIPHDPQREVPPGAVPFEFNGMQFYILPLASHDRS